MESVGNEIHANIQNVLGWAVVAQYPYSGDATADVYIPTQRAVEPVRAALEQTLTELKDG